MLVTLKKILEIAEEKKIAVGAFNAVSLASLKAVIGAAEETGQPVILQFAQCHEPYNSVEDVGPLMLKYAERASVPVCLHLDHGEDLAYLKKALDLGFTGIMIDASVLPYEQNVDLSAKAVEMAAPYGASVEAELGSMGRRESGDGAPTGVDDETKIYTDPAQAAGFVRETGIDALACSFGTTHGIYLKKPRLDFGVVSSVREITGGMPIVMHGGSGVSSDDFRKAIAAGVRKINYFTYMDRAGAQKVSEILASGIPANPLFIDLTAEAEKAMKENVKEAIACFSGL
ncbi:MAG: class II fructose-bisphosphate aldolase [Clostridia bacterium]|nr:class II fructose-bisphosphate aldolase [Clostridia bacterium]